MNITAIGHSSEYKLVNARRKTSLWAGIFYILTFVSIPTLTLYSHIHEPDYILGTSNDNEVIVGGILEIVVALCGIVTAVALYPVLKKQNKSLALGLVASRILEASTMFAGVAFLLTVVTLHQKGTGADALPVSQAFVTLYDRIFLLGQGFIPAINDLLLGIMLYQSRLVPRYLSLIGIVGGLPLLIGYFAILFGFIDRVSPLAGLSAVLVALFEFSIGIYLIIKGFKSSSLLAEN
ncbi:DUF4386 domain-containing protein [Emticicia sp. BO119]|uniref:DUF4386 domain-containing protein n=1 Tax=Emticicia sp. BO119 TaxID=2757768 RepID=UPI0015F0DEC4|nr:DUF4386 domain-containing protein [Emticicia sp. BO119]MBA4852418.1 DUF4386 domain-containing protein [Emticicia sp. BO119]